MRKYSRILSVIDPTSETQPALSRAAAIARASGASLELFISYYNEYLSGQRLFDSGSLEKARADVIAGHEEYLESLAQPLRDSGIEISIHALWAHPLDESIVRHAAAVGADLVFKDTHHHSALSRTLLTNTDWSLIRNCASPLWLVQPGELPERPVFLAAIDPMNEHDKPAALDDEIIVTGKALAALCNGELHVFHSYDPRMAVSSATASAYMPVSLPLDEMEEQMRREHAKRFDEIVDYHEIPRERRHLVAGLTHEELPALAKELGASLVVMGAVSRNRLKRLFIGATAERTLGVLPCDLLVVKPEWFPAPR